MKRNAAPNTNRGLIPAPNRRIPLTPLNPHHTTHLQIQTQIPLSILNPKETLQRRSIDSVNQPNRSIEWNTNPNGNQKQFNREGRKGSEGSQSNADHNTATHALADYVQIAPLPEFHGSEEENPDTHITRFLRACRINNANIPKAWILLFPITLQGNAAMWYDTQIEGNYLLEWAELQKAFIEAFRSPQHTEHLRQQLMKFRQESNESVRSYSERLQRILSKWPDHGIPDVILKGIYMDGFNEDGQDWLILQQPSSLKEAVRLSLHWEEAQNAKLGRKKERNNLGLENKGEIFDKKSQVFVERCEECEGKGHRMEECPNFLRKKTKTDQMNTMGWSVYLPIFMKRHLNKLKNWINSETGN
ncbi:hypothetical protein SUGI_0503500 [Cryptomeria japonica]|nr:hypothetical protein SUGI_0503500 [Cryptomeria japonica]